MSEITSPAVASTPEVSVPTKPVAAQGAITLQQAVAAQLAKMESARAPTPRLDPVAAEAAETTNQAPEGEESEQAEGVEQEEVVGEGEQATDETATAGQEIELTEDSEIILPNGERWTGKDLVDGAMKARDYTRKTQALSQREQAVESYVAGLRSKVQEIEHDLAAQRQQAQEVLKEGAAKRDNYAEQLKRIADAQREHVTQWDRVDWDRLQRESPERVMPLSSSAIKRARPWPKQRPSSSAWRGRARPRPNSGSSRSVKPTPAAGSARSRRCSTTSSRRIRCSWTPRRAILNGGRSPARSAA